MAHQVIMVHLAAMVIHPVDMAHLVALAVMVIHPVAMVHLAATAQVHTG